jgi:hypothetical protein
MMIEEIVRSCVHETVAQAAVRCIGQKFFAEIEEAATSYGMTPGAFAALSVERFARHGDEAEIRAVRAAMLNAQEPILSGLHRILCIMLAVGVPSDGGRRRDRAPRLQAMTLDTFEIAARCECCV